MYQWWIDGPKKGGWMDGVIDEWMTKWVNKWINW